MKVCSRERCSGRYEGPRDCGHSRTRTTGHNRPLVIRSEFLPLDRLGWLVYGGQFELRFGSSRPGAVVEPGRQKRSLSSATPCGQPKSAECVTASCRRRTLRVSPASASRALVLAWPPHGAHRRVDTSARGAAPPREILRDAYAPGRQQTRSCRATSFVCAGGRWPIRYASMAREAGARPGLARVPHAPFQALQK